MIKNCVKYFKVIIFIYYIRLLVDKNFNPLRWFGFFHRQKN